METLSKTNTFIIQQKNELLQARPYSVTSFEKNIRLFNDYIESVTYKQSEDAPEVRRQKLIGQCCTKKI